MGGPSQSTINTQNALTQQQLATAQQQNALQTENYNRMLQLEQPSINLYQGLVGGDAQKSIQTAMPFISQISQGYNAAKQGILDQTPPGAARDLALSQLSTQKDVNTANFMTQNVLGAYDKLANMGSGFGSFSLQELGASLSGLSGASGSNQALGKMQAEASPWNTIGSLVGDAMGMFSFGFNGGGSKDGGGVTNFNEMSGPDMVTAMGGGTM